MKLLRNSLRANGAFSAIIGVVTAVFAPTLAGNMDVSSILLMAVGIGVALFGILILWSTRDQDVDPGFGLVVLLADLSWVIGAIVLLAIPNSMSDKSILALVSVPVAVFVFFQAKGLVRSSGEDPLQLSATVVITAPPEAVWDQLLDLPSYETWNPFIDQASGTVVEGSQIKVRMGSMKFAPIVTELVEGRVFEWLGHLGVSGVFDGRHRFELSQSTDGTQLTQSEQFTGLLVSLFKAKLLGETRDNFEAMNEALRSRVESGMPHSI